jgi:hypothetical protein
LLAEADGRLGAGEDHNTVWRSLDPASLAEVFGDRPPQGQDPLGIAVVGVVEVDLSLHLVFHELRDGEVWFSQVAFDDPLSLFLQLTDIRADLEGVLGINESDALR